MYITLYMYYKFVFELYYTFMLNWILLIGRMESSIINNKHSMHTMLSVIQYLRLQDRPAPSRG